MDIRDILTTKEASDKWNLNDSTLRKACINHKFIDGKECRKSGGIWLITKEAMIKLYGILKEE